jgi:hypothetical protein
MPGLLDDSKQITRLALCLVLLTRADVLGIPVGQC